MAILIDNLLVQEGEHAHNPELEPLTQSTGQAGHSSDEDEDASTYDDDVASQASSEALALAVATEEAEEEEEEAAQGPRETLRGLGRLSSLLPRRADAVQEGETAKPLRYHGCQRRDCRICETAEEHQMRL